MSVDLGTLVNSGSWLCLTLGAFFCVVGGIGLLRLPDLYTRTHGAAITDTMGAGLVLLGLMLQAGLTLTTVKLFMVLAFMLLTGPAAGHALVKAARSHGLKPQVHESPAGASNPDPPSEPEPI